MEIYYFIFFATLIYFLFFFTKKIRNFMEITSQMNQMNFKKNEKNEKDQYKPQKFNSVLKERKSRLDRIIACKNS